MDLCIDINQKVWVTILKSNQKGILINVPKPWKCTKTTSIGFCLTNDYGINIPILLKWEKEPMVFNNGQGFIFKIDVKNPKPSFFQKAFTFLFD